MAMLDARKLCNKDIKGRGKFPCGRAGLHGQVDQGLLYQIKQSCTCCFLFETALEYWET